ncbi:class I SAM-dependent methyltransferase [Streptomyces nitrosporeus]|uniref:Class I SAM-dependent methyltransferase n=1 Tax=Streptomyces nitrosporeus TaxID=28894 RepID=A0A5J6FKK7_9ACTN|nr:cyclopropane-fatty-acyl-phospholipid synthase family protein [Streptomyces nitrosporeus]QEU75525.1 class I SAM-dependent methyltransferase [Streptomyces nitrosporeus]GGZ25171.1 cyclopropane-fatty-acyl-phospholipid synthase [Streptomyces nitrosporeus]
MTRPASASPRTRPLPQPAGGTVGPPRRSPDARPASAVRREGVDAGRWPDVARLPPAGPGRTAVAGYLVGRALDRLALTGPPAGARPPAAGPRLTLHDADAFHRRIGRRGLIGFGESYMAGEWDSDDLAGVLTVLAHHVDELVPAPLRGFRRLWVSARPSADRNTRAGARDNIHHHYDLSNDLFSVFLDPTLSYSSAVFAAFPARFESLAAAQHRKIDRLLDLAGVEEGTRLLEIGTGWGELALRAAARGARVTTLTLSAEQAALARERIAAAGLAGRAEVQLRDYRDVEGRYDAVVSVEMIEAVGAEYWPAYFTALRRALAPGGRIALQTITMGHRQMLRTATTHTFISKYVFPGGLIPSREAVAGHSAAAGLTTVADHGYGDHYAETLRLWRERFLAARTAVTNLGFDPVFQRMWEFYLAYSEAGFRSRYLDVRQLLLTEGTHR